MVKKLYWLDVLNKQAEWEDEGQILQWLSTIFGRKPEISSLALRYFEESCQLMRAILDSSHFGEELRLARLEQILSKVHVSVVLEEFLPASIMAVMPMFHASVAGANDDQILSAITNTLLLQFGHFLGGAGPNRQTPQICRCQGIVKHSRYLGTKNEQVKLTENELRWRQELEVFTENDLTQSTDIQRCADLYIANPKARFCSDACRFATFQFTKQLNDPDYHAEKQKRYRNKLSDKAGKSADIQINKNNRRK